jgi:hypothetical protein
MNYVDEKIKLNLDRTNRSMRLTPDYIKRNLYPTAFSMLYDGTCDKCKEFTKKLVKFTDLQLCFKCAIRSGLHAATFSTLEPLVVCEKCQVVYYKRDMIKLDNDDIICQNCLLV